MKKINLIISVLLLSSSLSLAQTDFQTSSFDDVNWDGRNSKPKIQAYPYLAASVLFRNQDKLTDKSFLKGYNSLNFYFAEAIVSVNGKNHSTPLFLLRKEKGKFSTDIFVDYTIIRKIPINLFGSTIPSITLNNDFKIKNEAVTIIKKVTEKVSPIIQNPASIYGPAAAQLAFSFLSEIVTQLNDSKEVKAKVNFEAIPNSDMGIKPHTYKVVILRPDNISITGNNFSIIRDRDNQIKLFNFGSVYETYPYFIIEIGLSNYYNLEGTPSNYYASKKNCSITESDLLELENSFKQVENQLSENQQVAENHLLNLYKLKYYIDRGIANQGTNSNLEALRDAYNALYDYKINLNETIIEKTILNDHFKSIYDNFKCINDASTNLALYRLITPIFSISKKDITKITNRDLSDIKNYITNTRNLAFINNTKFNASIVQLMTLVENEIYDSKFKTLTIDILNQTAQSEELTRNITNLISLKNQFDKCSYCLEEAGKAENHYTKILSNALETRNKIVDLVAKSNETIVFGNANIQKLEFFISKPGISTPIALENFRNLVIRLDNNKGTLNNKTSLPLLTASDLNEIRNLTAACNRDIESINSIINNSLNPFFVANQHILTTMN